MPQAKKNLGLSIALLIFVSLIAMMAHLAPPIQQLEESLGLNGLFELRGSRLPPDNVLIISIDRRSADQLDLPLQLRKWPRDIYAKLLDILMKHEVDVIGFDVFFREEKNAQHNEIFAEALSRSGNVVLFEFLKRDKVGLGDKVVLVETVIKPLPLFANSAAATGIYPLPRVPARVAQVWLFKPEINEKATLPVMMSIFQKKGIQLKLIRLIEEQFLEEWVLVKGDRQAIQGNSLDFTSELRNFFLQNTQVESALNSILESPLHPLNKHSALLQQLIHLYTSPHSRYVNFYGPRHTFKTVPISEVLNESNNLDYLKGKIVFIGFSDKSSTEEKDVFFTLYGSGDEALIAGVEIAATQFSNLMNNDFLVPLSNADRMLLYFLLGLSLIVLCAKIKTIYLFPVAFFFTTLYLFVAYQLFSSQNIWLPIVVPTLFQMPIVLFAFFGFRYLNLQQEKKNIREAFSFYLPENVVSQLEKNSASILNDGKSTFGVCLSTDVEHYTTLSEKTLPSDLHDLMNRYYEAIFEPIRVNKGYVSDVVGDAMLAVWLTPTPEKTKHALACEAALGVRKSVELFNQDNPTTPLPTRIGLHCGEMFVGNIGAQDRYVYRAMGDMVNTACRLEGLNKLTGTDILVSGEVCHGLKNIHTRFLGKFMLKGKRQPLDVHELLCEKRELSSNMLKKYLEFRVAQRFFSEEGAVKSRQKFLSIIDKYGKDGPSEFYLALCDVEHKTNPLNSIPYYYDDKTDIIHVLSK